MDDNNGATGTALLDSPLAYRADHDNGSVNGASPTTPNIGGDDSGASADIDPSTDTDPAVRLAEVIRGHNEELRELREAHARQLTSVQSEHTEERRRWTDQRTMLRAEAEREREELERFKVAVRDRALRAKASERWCDAGFNSAMEDLGLPLLVRQWCGTVTVDVTITGTQDETTAQMWARHALVSNDSDVEFDADDARVELEQDND